MKDFSITSALGYARLLVILGFCIAYLTRTMPLLEATAGLAFFLGVLGSAGLIYSKDASAPEEIARMTVQKEVDGTTSTTLTATVDEGKK